MDLSSFPFFSKKHNATIPLRQPSSDPHQQLQLTQMKLTRYPRTLPALSRPSAVEVLPSISLGSSSNTNYAISHRILKSKTVMIEEITGSKRALGLSLHTTGFLGFSGAKDQITIRRYYFQD